MSKWKIAWRSIQQRGLASTLTALSMALGVMLVVAVISIHGLVEQSFRNNSSLGYNMIVGATKGGRLQLVLNTVYYLSQPVENIPYSYYQEFLSAEDVETYRQAVGIDELGVGRDGKFRLFTKFAIPICMGDYYGHFRVIGTTPQLFDDFVYDLNNGTTYQFGQGRNFETFHETHGYFEAVIGAKVAREKQLEIGSRIAATHGDPEGELHDEHPFTVVGILDMTGTPIDRGVFVNIEGFYLMDGHAKPVPQDPREVPVQPPVPAGVIAATPPQTESKSTLTFQPLTVPEREVTAILIKTVNQVVTPGLMNTINEGNTAQAALPVAEIYGLFTTIVGPIKQVLLALTVMICVVSGVSILVSIYNSMSDRQHEIAVMRALGAGRGTVMSVVLFEAIILALGGGLIGFCTGHILIGTAGPTIEDQTGVAIGFFDFPSVNVNEYFNVDWLIGAINGVRGWGGYEPVSSLPVPTELWLIPGLILLAVAVGLLPAMAAYRTDVSRALSANP